jgi:hypothetical protein
MMAVVTPITRPLEIEQRAARIAGIDRRIRLDRIGYFAAGARRQAATERADDAGRQRLVEPERIADRVSELADPEVGRAADVDGLRRQEPPRQSPLPADVQPLPVEPAACTPASRGWLVVSIHRVAAAISSQIRRRRCWLL